MRRWIHHPAAAAPAVATAVFVGLAGVAIAQGAPAEPIGVTQPSRVTEDVEHPTRAYQSPSLLVHPDDPGTVVAAGLDMSTNRCRLFRATGYEAAWSWLENASPSPEDQPLCFQGAVYGYQNETPIAWGSDNALYWGVSGRARQADGEDVSVLVSRSADLGDTWTSTLVDDGLPPGEFEFISRPITGLAVDAESAADDLVYVGWQTFPEGEPRTPKVAVSTDGGASFSEGRAPFDAETSEELGGEGGLQGLPPKLAVDDDGVLYVLFPGQAGGDEEPDEVPNRLLLARSEDRGETFTVSEVAEVHDANVGPMFAWSPHGGEDGTLHIVYEDRREEPYGPRDIFYQRSADGGETFTEPEKLNDEDPDELYAQVNPNISVAPNGRVDVAWWDWRDGAAVYGNDVYYTYSPDDGDTWARNVRVTDQSIDRRIGYWGNNADMRSSPGIASTNQLARVAWSDTRLAGLGSNTQDIFAATVQLDEVPTGDADSALWYVIAVLVGLTAGGLVLVVLGLALRLRSARRGHPAPSPAP